MPRLQRWPAEKELVDMNGRFGMNRHVEVIIASTLRLLSSPIMMMIVHRGIRCAQQVHRARARR